MLADAQTAWVLNGVVPATWAVAGAIAVAGAMIAGGLLFVGV